jgi:hypothetical protein
MRLLAFFRARLPAGCLAALLALLACHSSQGASSVDMLLGANAAPAGFVAVNGVEAGAFNPAIWQAGTLNLVPDLRSPILAPQSGTYRNIYAPSAVETPEGYRLFYGGWDGAPSGNDRIYSANTDIRFQEFWDRHAVIIPGSYIHVCNVNALRSEDGAFQLFATVYPTTNNLNKPAFFQSDATGANWNGLAGEPYTVQAQDIIDISGYPYAKADINGMNVMLREGASCRLYFGDFQAPGGTYRATSADGKHFTFEAKVLAGPGAVNDVKKFRVGATDYYLMGLHENGPRLWQTVSTNGLSFPAARTFLTNLDRADAYIVALGWVTRGPQESPGRKLLGVLYGAGASPALDENRIFARWLQRRVVFVASNGMRLSGMYALGPNQQLLAIPGSGPLIGKFEIYAEDGLTLLGTSGVQAVSSGQLVQLPQPAEPHTVSH